MIASVLNSQATLKFAVGGLAVIVSIVLFRALVWFTRLGRKPSERRTFSDLPDLVHGPQELNRSVDEVRASGEGQ